MLVRRSLLPVLTCTSLAACTGGHAVHGLFNNERDYDAAYAAHLQAWDRTLGRSARIEDVREAFQARGGACAVPNGFTVLDCGLDVLPRYPSILTRRIFWTMTFVPEDTGRVRLRETKLYHLGSDL
jgi:hypothetical protein